MYGGGHGPYGPWMEVGPRMGGGPRMDGGPRAPRAPEIPPGLAGILPDDPFERARMIRDQQRIEAMIQGRGQPHGFFPHDHPGAALFIQEPNPDVNGFVHRMGELLQLREEQRQNNRAIRRREQQALEEFQNRHGIRPEVGVPGRPFPRPPNPPPPAPPVAAGGPVVGAAHVAAHAAAQVAAGRNPHWMRGHHGPLPAHIVQPAPPLPPHPPPAHGGRDNGPPRAHQRAFNPHAPIGPNPWQPQPQQHPPPIPRRPEAVRPRHAAQGGQAHRHGAMMMYPNLPPVPPVPIMRQGVPPLPPNPGLPPQGPHLPYQAQRQDIVMQQQRRLEEHMRALPGHPGPQQPRPQPMQDLNQRLPNADFDDLLLGGEIDDLLVEFEF